jgi:hypothetical protein
MASSVSVANGGLTLKIDNSTKIDNTMVFHIVMAKFPIPENCSAHVPMILKEFY